MAPTFKIRRLLRFLAAALFMVSPPTVGAAGPNFVPPPPQLAPDGSAIQVVQLWPSPGFRAPQPTLNGVSDGDTTLLSKTASPASVAPDGSLAYSIAVTNATTVNQTFRITDTLPAGLTYITNTASPGLFYNAAPNNLTATAVLTGFQADITTTITGALTYTEMISDSRSHNICVTDFAICDNNAIGLAGVPFRYLGVDYTNITLSSNGFVMPGLSNPGPAFQNQNLPDPGAPNNVIAPFWSDLHFKGITDTVGGDWLWAVLPGPNSSGSYLVVEWHNAQKKGVPGTSYSFQVWIKIQAEQVTFAYDHLTGTTAAATIGFENSDGTLGNSYLYNGAGPVPAAGSELQLDPKFATAQFSFNARAPHNLRGCSSISNTANLTNALGTLTRLATATTLTFGPCLFLPAVSR